ncbi:Lipid-binding SYLF domain-containing protein [Alteromonadaceae bacterium Bs31]|nr:Lipid-binding SYLF domain-containing protein [Alteromonadaceae bacterium Bs31]
MKHLSHIIISVLLVLPLSFAYGGEGKDEKYAESLATFKENPIVQKFLSKAYGYALFPTIGKGGLGIGGAHGKGRVYKSGTETGTTKMTQITIGFQAGGQAYSQIILFENKKSFDKFTSGEFEFGAQATAVAIKASAGAAAGTTGNTAGATSKGDAGKQTAEWVNNMVVFTYAKGGLMYEASLGGQKFSYKSKGESKKK